MTDRTAYERLKRWRTRSRHHICVVAVEIGETEIDTLTDAGHLDDKDSADPFKIAMAVKRMITRNQKL